MTWTSQSYSFGSLLTATKMTQLYDNLTALANGDAGAPNITQASLANSAVGQGELKSTTASSTTAVPNGGASVALTGGTYGFWTAGSAATSSNAIGFGHANEAAGTLGMQSCSGNFDFYLDERYIQASPPYDMGDGDVQLFVFAVIDNSTGKISSISLAQEPTWAYHGPTIITPTRMYRDIDGSIKKFRMEQTLEGIPLAKARKDKKLFADYMSGKKIPVISEIEITKEYKNSDMNTHSNMWVYNKPEFFTGKTLVMLDPFCKEMQMLADIQRTSTAKDALNVICDNFVFDNVDINRAGPNGIPVRSLKWIAK